MYPGKQAMLRTHVPLFGIVGRPLGQKRCFVGEGLSVYRPRLGLLQLGDGFGSHGVMAGCSKTSDIQRIV